VSREGLGEKCSVETPALPVLPHSTCSRHHAMLFLACRGEAHKVSGTEEEIERQLSGFLAWTIST